MRQPPSAAAARGRYSRILGSPYLTSSLRGLHAGLHAQSSQDAAQVSARFARQVVGAEPALQPARHPVLILLRLFRGHCRRPAALRRLPPLLQRRVRLLLQQRGALPAGGVAKPAVVTHCGRAQGSTVGWGG